MALRYLRAVDRETHPSAAADPVSALGQVAADFATGLAHAREEVARLRDCRAADLQVLRAALRRLRQAGAVPTLGDDLEEYLRRVGP